VSGVDRLRELGGPAILGVEHVAIAVPDLDAALTTWRDRLGFALVGVEPVPEQQVTTARLELGPHCVELVAPTSPDSPVGRFLTKRGPGLHHVCLDVVGIEALLARLAAAGVELIDRAPKRGAHERLIAFVHPRATGGVLVELSEKA